MNMHLYVRAKQVCAGFCADHNGKGQFSEFTVLLPAGIWFEPHGYFPYD